MFHKKRNAFSKSKARKQFVLCLIPNVNTTFVMFYKGQLEDAAGVKLNISCCFFFASKEFSKQNPGNFCFEAVTENKRCLFLRGMK